MVNSNQPTILVKKSDGTTVRMTMDELQAYQKTQVSGQNTQSVSTSVKPVSPKPDTEKLVDLAPSAEQLKRLESVQKPAPVVKPAQPVKPVSPAPQAKMEEKPVVQMQKPEPPKPPVKNYMKAPPKDLDEMEEKWEVDDHKSLLDDSLVEAKLPMVKNISASLPATQAPVKDIFVDEAKYKVEQNKQVMPTVTKAAVSVPIKPVNPPKNPVTAKPSVVTPVLPQQKFEKPKSEVKPPIKSVIPIQPAETVYIPAAAKLPEAKAFVQDIRPPQVVKQSVGPVDEIANFSLVDFRRLEGNAAAAGNKLLEKFKILEHDSFLLFLDGVKAWYNSPLYKQYQDILYRALTHRKNINEILAEEDKQKGLKPEEFKAILALNAVIN